MSTVSPGKAPSEKRGEDDTDEVTPTAATVPSADVTGVGADADVGGAPEIQGLHDARETGGDGIVQ